jgi:hypothetical protein
VSAVINFRSKNLDSLRRLDADLNCIAVDLDHFDMDKIPDYDALVFLSGEN